MSGLGKYIVGALVIAVIAHFAFLYAFPRVLMGVAMERLSGHGLHYNSWQHAERVTENSRTIVRPSPDLHYSACPYDLGHGPITFRVTPWADYWSISFYADNSDNFFVLDDREARQGAEIVLIRQGSKPLEHVERVVESPSQRGVALVRRLAPTGAAFDDASAAAQTDVCALIARN